MTAQPNRQIAFVLNNISDYQMLVTGIPQDTPVYVLDANGDALAQMASILGNYHDLDAIHLLSHGSSGAVNLGEISLSNDNLNQYSDTLAQIGSSLTAEGDILVYGCNVANGEVGKDFIGKLALATGADIAASDDLTGSGKLGGDWVLETKTDETVSELIIYGYAKTLATPSTLTTFATGSLQTLVSRTTSAFSYDNLSGWDVDVAMSAGAYELRLTTLAGTDGTLLLAEADAAPSVGPWTTWSMKSDDGSEFQLKSFNMRGFSTGSYTYEVEGYRNGVKIGSSVTTVSIANTAWGSLDVSSNSDFENIDQFIIKNINSNESFRIDEILIGPAVVAVSDSTPPTASVTTATLKNTDSAIVQSTETGTAYIVKDTVTVTDLASITGAADNNFNSVAISTINSDTSLSLAGLVDGTYKVYTVDAAGNLSVVSSNSVTIDSTAPTFDVAASVASVTSSGFTPSASLNESGTVYYVVVANGATAPTVAEVKVGTASGGGAALASGNNIASTGSFDTGFSAVTGLSASTDYDVYFVAKDATNNDQTSVTKVDVTTSAAVAPTTLTAYRMHTSFLCS